MAFRTRAERVAAENRYWGRPTLRGWLKLVGYPFPWVIEASDEPDEENNAERA